MRRSTNLLSTLAFVVVALLVTSIPGLHMLRFTPEGCRPDEVLTIRIYVILRHLSVSNPKENEASTGIDLAIVRIKDK